MFPLRDDIPSRRAPVVVWALVFLNAIVFMYEKQLPEAELKQFVERFALTPAWLTAPGGLAQHWTTLFTHMFLHGGWLHLIGNLWYLWIFGDNVSDRFGSGRFLLLYVAGGLAAAALQVHVSPQMQVPMVGASGAIAAVLGAYLVLYAEGTRDHLHSDFHLHQVGERTRCGLARNLVFAAVFPRVGLSPRRGGNRWRCLLGARGWFSLRDPGRAGRPRTRSAATARAGRCRSFSATCRDYPRRFAMFIEGETNTCRAVETVAS